MATQIEFEYDMARFIGFRDREACERVRRITRAELTEHPSTDFRIRVIDARLVAGVLRARDARAVLRPRRRGPAAAGGPDPHGLTRFSTANRAGRR